MDLREVSVPALAYLGDCVLELMVRERLVISGLAKSGDLNRAALQYVCAAAQAEATERILPALNESERAYFHRGRNSGHLNYPKNASPAQYRTATGLEVLFGYLHLSGQADRQAELFALAYPAEIFTN